jgi:glucosamine kinase
MSYWLGIDGGGSNLRVVITADDLTPIATTFGETANPSVIGREASADRIHVAVHEALSQAGLDHVAIAGAGVGIAGASVAHSESWLRQILAVILPGVPAVPSSDVEIALIGANGERQGVLLLAGTGSAVFGVNAAGQSLQVGGWGYLLGDEGSSYWIGMRVLQLLARAADGRETCPPVFTTQILAALALESEADLIPWLYRSEQPRTRDIAQLARLVIENASVGVEVAAQIAQVAASELALLCHTMIRRLDMENPRIAFAGGLLDNDNFLSTYLCQMLGLNQRPIPLYPPVIGAALLAQIMLKG